MDQKAINVIRNLALDMIMNTGAGHPGITMTSAPILYTLFTKFLIHKMQQRFYMRQCF